MEFYYDEVDNNVLIIRADGGLNKETSAQFVGELEKLIEAGLTRIIVDCTLVDYISSYGVGVLARLHAKLRQRGGDVKVCNVKGIVRDFLELTRLDRIFEVYPDVNRARLAFRGPDDHE